MKKVLFFAFVFCFLTNFVPAQTARQAVPQQSFDLTEYGIKIQPDARLIVVTLALEAAGLDSKQNSIFRRQVQEDLKNLDPDLRRRLREFFARNNKNYETASPAEQISRYISLAFALSPAPEFGAPERSTELPAGLLEVLDFAPLVREFYRKSGVAEKLPEYQRKYQAVGDSLRPQTAAMLRDLTGFLNTRPQTVYFERITIKNPAADAKSKKPVKQNVITRERARNFYLVPDLLAAPGSVKLRVIGDDYYVSVAQDVVASESSELRRAYLQFLIDALFFKNAKEISLQKDAIRGLLTDFEKTGVRVSPDVYLAVARSLVVASDAKQAEFKKIAEATRAAREKIEQAKTTPEKLTVSENLKQTKAAIERETFAALSEAYQDGAVLAFFFADQLRGLESSGFDIASSLTDMIATFDAGKEKARLKETETARKQALTEIAARRRQSAETEPIAENNANDARNLALVKNLKEAEEMVNLRDFDQAERLLKNLLNQNPGEPRIFFALGRTAGLSAAQALDEAVRDERLQKAGAFYRGAILASNDETPRSLLSQAHVALGRIYEFYDKNDDALKEFDAAIVIGDVKAGAYQDALAGKARLSKK